ncbi:MAG: MarR family winged helix-turn-helix transcriptional regulator [Cyclobacteriaceae bacterium]
MKEKEIQQVRDFNRYYTSIIGVLDQHYLNSPFSLPEGRVLFELHHRQPCSASDLIEAARMDKGYLSRVLKSFQKKRIVTRKQSKVDGRAFQLMLSPKGEKEFNALNIASRDLVTSLLGPLPSSDVTALINHMNEIKRILNKTSGVKTNSDE